MRNDVAVLIRQAEAGGAAFRMREGRVEARGLEHLPQGLVDELRVHKDDVLKHLAAQGHQAVSPDTSRLLAWASELGEQDLVLPNPVSYIEAPLRSVTTHRVSWYAAHYLKTIAAARLYQQHPKLCWGQWTPEWWREREEEAFGALASLRKALGERQSDVN